MALELAARRDPIGLRAVEALDILKKTQKCLTTLAQDI